MAIRSLPDATCSLNLGLIYRLSMSFQPGDGVRITAYFVNERGVYVLPQLTGQQEAFIRFGAMSFTVLPVSYELGLAYGRRIMQVTFVDRTRLLDQYNIVLPGRGCGENIIVLGNPVNPSLLLPKNDNERIQNYTQFQDYEYSFGEFVEAINKVITISAPANVDNSITKPFTGTLREVLNAWCSFFGLAWYVHGSRIIVINPTSFQFFPPPNIPPTDAIDYSVFKSIENCFDTTAALYFNQLGGYRVVNQAASLGNLKIDGDLSIRTATLYPIGYEFSLTQVTPDLKQVAAAMYGKAAWFLYNYYYNNANMATECGWTPLQQITQVNDLSIRLSMGALGANTEAAGIDEDFFDQKFEAYAAYGRSIAGRYYLSNERGNINDDQTFAWFNEADGQIFDYTTESAQALAISSQLKFLYESDNPKTFGGAPPDFPDTFFPQKGLPDGFQNVVEGTTINQFYPGVNYTNNRMLYVDNAFPDIAANFAVAQSTASAMDNLFGQYFNGMEGSRSYDFSQAQSKGSVGPRKFVVYSRIDIDGNPLWAAVKALLLTVKAKSELFQPRYDALNISGIKEVDLNSLKNAKEAKDEGRQFDIVISGNTPNSPVISNTSYIKAMVEGEYALYFAKYSKCIAASSTPDPKVKPIKRKFQLKDVSNDIEIPVTLTKTSGNAYKLNRDLTILNQTMKESLVRKFAIGNYIPEERTTFKTNYLVEGITVDFFSQGLVSFDLEIGDNGIEATYTFGNTLLRVPDYPAAIEKLEQEIKNSWIRTFNPPATSPSA